ncbi:MAG: VOC family protein [Balneolaceae bacterium]|nr:VOC family protein [Balneolaceae bacterium]
MKISGILETCLYASDLQKAADFYTKLPGLQLITKEDRRHLFFKCGITMLLIFNPDHTSSEQTDMGGDIIPLHGSRGPGHVAFSVKDDEISLWREFLNDQQIPIESEVSWPNGSVSLYFRDPAGNSLEVVSPKIWKRKTMDSSSTDQNRV